MFSLTSEEVEQVANACARVMRSYSTKDRSVSQMDGTMYGMAQAQLLSHIGLLFAVVDAIEAKESDGPSQESPF